MGGTPTSSTTIQRPDLGALAFEHAMSAAARGFIGLEIMPIFEAARQSADYPVIPTEALLKTVDTRRAPRAAYSRGDYEFETKTYSCKEHGREEPIDDVERALYANLFSADEVATIRATSVILTNQEKRIQALVNSTANITNNAAVSTEWSTAATCTPREDVIGAKRALRLATGIMPDTMAISLTVLENLLLAAEIKDALKYTDPIEMGGLEAQKRQLSAYFGVNRLLIGGGMEDTAKKGQSTVIADIWDDEYCLLFKAGGGTDLKDPSLGRTFLWLEDSPDNLVTEQYREEKIRSDVFRVRHNVHEVFLFTGAGYLLTNITA